MLLRITSDNLPLGEGGPQQGPSKRAKRALGYAIAVDEVKRACRR